jgi:hypothetical protein
MVIARQDWVKDTDWHEAHLTPGGWRDGTYRSDKGYIFERQPPADRLMTVRHFECIPADPSPALREWSEIVWRTENVEALESTGSLGGTPGRVSASVRRLCR